MSRYDVLDYQCDCGYSWIEEPLDSKSKKPDSTPPAMEERKV